jgi:hypothetical protein
MCDHEVAERSVPRLVSKFRDDVHITADFLGIHRPCLVYFPYLKKEAYKITLLFVSSPFLNENSGARRDGLY